MLNTSKGGIGYISHPYESRVVCSTVNKVQFERRGQHQSIARNRQRLRALVLLCCLLMYLYLLWIIHSFSVLAFHKLYQEGKLLCCCEIESHHSHKSCKTYGKKWSICQTMRMRQCMTPSLRSYTSSSRPRLCTVVKATRKSTHP